MAIHARHGPLLPGRLLRLTAPAPMAPVALLLLAMAFGGLGLNVLGRSSSMPATPATVIGTEAADTSALDPPHGDLPIIGDPIRDFTIWWSNRVSYANRAALESLKGQTLSPVDPMADNVVREGAGGPLASWGEQSRAQGTTPK